jgi:hypothetical protein
MARLQRRMPFDPGSRADSVARAPVMAEFQWEDLESPPSSYS